MKTLIPLDIKTLDVEANGVARTDAGKVIFVRGALPGERVVAELLRNRSKHGIATTRRVLKSSNSRVVPSCEHFGVCGGCSLQHLEASAQVAAKQRILEDQLWAIGRVRPQTVLRPLYGPMWEYRQRARWSVRYVEKKGGAVIGFRERNARYVVDTNHCPVLPKRVSALLPHLRSFVNSLSVREKLPQIELAVGTAGASSEPHIALVFRVLDRLLEADVVHFRHFAQAHLVELWLQLAGPESAELLCDAQGRLMSEGAMSPLQYLLPEFKISLAFHPTQFTQINHALNRALVTQVVRLLAPKPCDTVLDLFCGLGNFSLPISRYAGAVVGIEGSDHLVARAQENARRNELSQSCRFKVADLFLPTAAAAWAEVDSFNKVLLDPPRDGAVEVVKALSRVESFPERVVYVSCNPATLARDAEILVHHGGFTLRAAGVVNMFPHTAHVESVAVFDKVRHQSSAEPLCKKTPPSELLA